MRVFWSWQSDFAPKSCRHFIREALLEAINAAGAELGLEDAERPEIDHDTKGTLGMVEITATILEKISRSAVFVADVTTIGETGAGKALPNPNVMIELGWAMSELGPERIIVVLNEASGSTPDDLPFDIRHRRVLTYSLADGVDSKTRQAAKKDLVRSLTAVLAANLGEYVETQAATRSIEGVPAKPGNRSIWATVGAELEHNDSMGPGHRTSILLPDIARGYIRIIPAGWKSGVPSVSEIARLTTLWPPGSGGSGNFGPCDEGFVRYLMSSGGSDGVFEALDVSMFFDQTGELWFLHGTAVGEGKRGSTLRDAALLRGWQESMRTTFKEFDRLGASSARKVEAGLVGVRGVRWPGDWNAESPPARKGECLVVRQRRDWSEEAQLEFLTDAYNEVRDLFSFPRATSADVAKMISGR